MKKIINIVLLALLAIAALSVILWIAGVVDVDMMLYVAYAYLLVAVVAVVVLTVLNMGKGRSNSRIGLYVFGGLAVLAVVLYFVVAKADVVIGADATKVFDDPFTLKISDTMLYLAYAALGLVVLFLLAGEVRKALK